MRSRSELTVSLGRMRIAVFSPSTLLNHSVMTCGLHTSAGHDRRSSPTKREGKNGHDGMEEYRVVTRSGLLSGKRKLVHTLDWWEIEWTVEFLLNEPCQSL